MKTQLFDKHSYLPTATLRRWGKVVHVRIVGNTKQEINAIEYKYGTIDTDKRPYGTYYENIFYVQGKHCQIRIDGNGYMKIAFSEKIPSGTGMNIHVCYLTN